MHLLMPRGPCLWLSIGYRSLSLIMRKHGLHNQVEEMQYNDNGYNYTLKIFVIGYSILCAEKKDSSHVKFYFSAKMVNFRISTQLVDLNS